MDDARLLAKPEAMIMSTPDASSASASSRGGGGADGGDPLPAAFFRDIAGRIPNIKLNTFGGYPSPLQLVGQTATRKVQFLREGMSNSTK